MHTADAATRAFKHTCWIENDGESSGCSNQSILIFNRPASGVRDSSIVLLCLFASAGDAIYLDIDRLIHGQRQI